MPKKSLAGFNVFRPVKPINTFSKQNDILIHYVDEKYKSDLHKEVMKKYLEASSKKISHLQYSAMNLITQILKVL